MYPRPTRSTLFPYTTLFRSLHNWAAWTGLGIGLLHPLPLLFAAHDRFRPLDIAFPVWSPVQPVENLLDRKSTRLNSSHPSISYAVFCLKKKNINTYYYIRNV